MILQGIFKKIYGLSSILVLICMFSFPLVVFGAEEPGTGFFTYGCVSAGPSGGQLYGNCTWDDLIAATKKATNFGAEFALTFSVVVIAFAGFKYMVSQGNPGELKKANAMFVSVAKGIFFILAAWLIVNLITTSLLNEDVLSTIPIAH